MLKFSQKTLFGQGVESMHSNLSVTDHYSKYFYTQKAMTPALKAQAFYIRYCVYCEELKKLSPKSATELQETDDWDSDSTHILLFHKTENKPIGNARVISIDQCSEKKLPIELYYQSAFDFTNAEIKSLREGKMGEISRMALLSDFRRRQCDRDYSVDTVDKHVDPNNRRFPVNYLPMCLAYASIALLIEQQLDYGVALMEPRLAKLLVRFGIKLKQIGQPIDHFGLRAPFLIFPEDTYQNLSSEYQCLFDTITSELNFS